MFVNIKNEQIDKEYLCSQDIPAKPGQALQQFLGLERHGVLFFYSQAYIEVFFFGWILLLSTEIRISSRNACSSARRGLFLAPFKSSKLALSLTYLQQQNISDLQDARNEKLKNGWPSPSKAIQKLKQCVLSMLCVEVDRFKQSGSNEFQHSDFEQRFEKCVY